MLFRNQVGTGHLFSLPIYTHIFSSSCQLPVSWPCKCKIVCLTLFKLDMYLGLPLCSIFLDHFQTRIFQQPHTSLVSFVDLLCHAGLVQLQLPHWAILKIVSHTHPPISYFRVSDILSFHESCLERSPSRQLCLSSMFFFQKEVIIQFKHIKLSQFMG